MGFFVSGTQSRPLDTEGAWDGVPNATLSNCMCLTLGMDDVLRSLQLFPQISVTDVPAEEVLPWETGAWLTIGIASLYLGLAWFVTSTKVLADLEEDRSSSCLSSA